MGDYTGNRQSGTTDENPVFRSLGVIEERIREKLTVKSLADSVHFSQYHYQRLFREAVGDSVMGYVARRRISLAAAELAETDGSVLEIALKYGYDSHEGFTRSFRAHMGITPTEYRKYHLSTSPLEMQKEKCAMIYSKAADEMIRELNGLIVQAKETAEYTRKTVEANSGTAVFYARFWDVIVDRTESMAEGLARILTRITAIAQQPDEISARLMILKAMEDAVFQSGMIAFQAGLTIARAMPEHREAFRPVCLKYESLAGNARGKAGRIGEFLQELWQLIFQDMRKNAEGKIRQAVEKGMEAAGELSGDPALPYAYIADEVRSIAEELSAIPLEEMTAARLENDLVRLEMIAFAVDVDVLRAPAHRSLLETIYAFREELREAAEFFRSLPGDVSCVPGEPEQRAGNRKCGISGSGWNSDDRESGDRERDDRVSGNRELTCRESGHGESVDREEDCRELDSRKPDNREREFREPASRQQGLWGNVLLFYLKGEIQKLGDARLTEEQQAAFGEICGKMKQVVQLAGETADLSRQVYQELTIQGEGLGGFGAAIRYLAEEWRRVMLEPDV